MLPDNHTITVNELRTDIARPNSSYLLPTALAEEVIQSPRSDRPSFSTLTSELSDLVHSHTPLGVYYTLGCFGDAHWAQPGPQRWKRKSPPRRKGEKVTLCMCMGHDHSSHEIEGQGQRSRLGSESQL